MDEIENIPPAKPAPTKTEMNLASQKDFLIENYLPNLSNYQKVIKRITKYTEKKKKNSEIIFTLSPNVNYTNQKDYFIFYNDNLKILIDLYRLKLRDYIDEHYFVLYCKEDNLNKTLKNLGFDEKLDNSYGPLKLVSNLISQWNEEIVEQANILAKSLNTLTSIRDNFTDKVTKDNMCAVIVSENLFDENIKEKLYFNNTESKTCLNYLSEIEEIKEKQMDDIEKLKLMNHKVDEFKKEIKPENSIDNIIDFCFVLNKISEYLSNFERSLQTKQYEQLKVMDKFRRKLDYYLLEFRYKFVENNDPILKIKIKRYKILCDSLEITSIYLERGEVKSFMKLLREELDKKAKNINSFYQFQDIDIRNIINIAKEINFNTYEDLIEGFESKINNLQDQLSMKKKEFFTFIGKEALKFAFDQYSGLNIQTNETTKNIPLEKIDQFIFSDNEIKKKLNNTPLQNDKNEIKEDESQKILEERKQNLNSIGIDANKMNNDIIDKISHSFQMYHDMTKINRDIEKYKKLKERMQDKLNYSYDFYNALKLYCCIEKKDIENNDYIGIMLEEKNKDKANELREYSVYKFTELQSD